MKKNNNTVQQNSKHDNTMNERSRQPSTEQKKKNTLADSNYFYRGINTVQM